MGKGFTHDEFINLINDRYPNKYKVLSRYTKAKEKVSVVYNECGHTADTAAKYLLSGKNCPICNRGTRLSTDELKERLNNLYGDDFTFDLSNHVNNKSILKIKHNICESEFTRSVDNLLYKGLRCPKCNKESASHLYIGINDIHTTNPYLESLLKYKEDAYKLTSFTKKKAWFICPDCGKEVYDKVFNVSQHNRVPCDCSKTSISLCERIMMELLKYLNIDYKMQYSPKWIGKYRYDFYFVHKNKEYIVEMDGGWHFVDNNLSGKKLEQQLKRDEYKDNAAKEHNIELIRIDCNYLSNDPFEYVVNSIINSHLRCIFDFNDVDFNKVINDAKIPLLILIVDTWNSIESDNRSVNLLCEKLNLSDTTIRKYLYKAVNLSLIEEDIEEIKLKNLKYRKSAYTHPRSTRVMCNETGEIFDTIAEASKKYHANISSYFLEENRKFAGTLSNGTRLTWTKLAS